MPTTMQRLPTHIEERSRGGDRFKTNIPPEASSGHEQRVQEWDACRYYGDVSYGIRAINAGGVSDLVDVIKMHRRMRGNYGTFPFRDWHDYQVSNGYIATGDGTTADFQLVKRYLLDSNNNDADDEGLEYIRTVTLPEEGTVRVFVAAVEKTITTHFTVDYDTGIISFTAGNEPANAARITATFDFNKHVRFNLANDQLDIELAAATDGSVPQLPIVEVIGE